MKFTEKIKTAMKKFVEYITEDNNSNQSEYTKQLQEDIKQLETMNAAMNIELAKKKELPPLTAYETRRQEIQDSSGQIEGIFYLYDGKIIPDYYSECLLSDKENPCRDKMYHRKFYSNYMMMKYNELPYGEKSLPRGRIRLNLILIDACYAEDEAILEQLRELYRLLDKMTIMTPSDYDCPNCRKY